MGLLDDLTGGQGVDRLKGFMKYGVARELTDLYAGNRLGIMKSGDFPIPQIPPSEMRG